MAGSGGGSGGGDEGGSGGGAFNKEKRVVGVGQLLAVCESKRGVCKEKVSNQWY